jgi:hypothetical protein
MKLLQRTLLILCATALIYSPAQGGEVDVEGVEVTRTSPGIYRFRVTLRHDDTGWDHYADSWEVRGAGGAVLATRVLVHPHVNEQPFTRSLSGVQVPAELNQVTIAGHDSVHGYGGVEMIVDLPD